MARRNLDDAYIRQLEKTIAEQRRRIDNLRNYLKELNHLILILKLFKNNVKIKENNLPLILDHYLRNHRVILKTKLLIIIFQVLI